MSTGFTAGQKIRASYFNIPAAATLDLTVTDGTTTSTTFVNSLTTTGIIGVVFTGPYSGQSTVRWMTTGRAAAGAFSFSSVEVRTGSTIGSGTVVAASDENTACSYQSDSLNQQGQHCGFRLITGLTFGTVYNACITYRVNTGTGAYNRRSINVEPAP